ncbi:MAG TPA: hypothetical protein VFK47_15565, partial [Ktedonobacteraceae bacterium]|nr:hypothetical protein [Ktedonobacteraceae bacterium]
MHQPSVFHPPNELVTITVKGASTPIAYTSPEIGLNQRGGVVHIVQIAKQPLGVNGWIVTVSGVICAVALIPIDCCNHAADTQRKREGVLRLHVI